MEEEIEAMKRQNKEFKTECNILHKKLDHLIPEYD
jgi:hypothetical protein